MLASRLGTVIGIAVLLVGSASVTHAQTPTSGWAEPAIVDNSFLVEEAYNQEAGIVQHISTLTRSASSPRDYVYTLTQEWPFSTERHQLSYSVPVAFLRSASASGLGDVMFNYRYSVPLPILRATTRAAPTHRTPNLAASGVWQPRQGARQWGVGYTGQSPSQLPPDRDPRRARECRSDLHAASLSHARRQNDRHTGREQLHRRR